MRTPGIRDLFDATWPGIAARIAAADMLGFPWEEVSTPFVHRHEDDAVAHVGLLRVPVVIAGREQTIAGIHAVCTRPDHRGHGLCGALLERALHAAEGFSPTAMLCTLIPAFFERFGFRVVAEHRFVARAPRAPRGRPFRRLSAREPADVRLLHEILPRRAPLSLRYAARDPGWMFAINEVLATGGLDRLHVAPDLGFVAAFEVQERTLQLLDLAAEEIPPLAEIVARVEGEVDAVVTYFAPDRLGGRFEAQPHALGGEVLMVRGPFAAEAMEIMAPPLARC